jgi:hypothetical protein
MRRGKIENVLGSWIWRRVCSREILVLYEQRDRPEFVNFLAGNIFFRGEIFWGEILPLQKIFGGLTQYSQSKLLLRALFHPLQKTHTRPTGHPRKGGVIGTVSVLHYLTNLLSTGKIKKKMRMLFIHLRELA